MMLCRWNGKRFYTNVGRKEESAQSRWRSRSIKFQRRYYLGRSFHGQHYMEISPWCLLFKYMELYIHRSKKILSSAWTTEIELIVKRNYSDMMSSASRIISETFNLTFPYLNWSNTRSDRCELYEILNYLPTWPALRDITLDTWKRR